jgi:acyl carrier protein
MSTTDRLRNFIVSELGWRGGELDDDYPLIENHVIDSLGLFQLVGFLETEYGVTIDDADLTPDKFGTLNAIAELIERSKPAEHTADQDARQPAA